MTEISDDLLRFLHKYTSEAIENDGVVDLAKERFGPNPLGAAVGRGSADEVRVLLNAKAPLQITDANGAGLGVPAYQPTDVMSKVFCVTLFDDTWQAFANSSTALHLAAAKGNAEIVQELLAAKAWQDVKAHDGSTVLHAAAVQGNVEVLELLLPGKVPLDAKNNDGHGLNEEAWFG
eukprot:Skav216820  [mRNA]  locus=scaffold135:192226:194031:- [translate_table: standard]